MMAFTRAEREGDWLLHLRIAEMMIPYFYAAGHHTYFRYGTYHVMRSYQIHGDTLTKFLNGEHVMRHQFGFWNGI